eukprot:CAMPEP_0196136956 /NCGR_PEP_ID=MMETSP0910-20130528/5090_1 /TAXON_ID=49265 /ORGANISM="Thalassiosira rotula, Strain GSO102" /LENGTH=266 /DNA_ID=CAMNT_0041397325 /DNA_START=17 /DNA_END=814 /DNA_ORIENTATION=+
MAPRETQRRHHGDSSSLRTIRRHEYRTYPPATDCATSNYPRLIHTQETWIFLQNAYAHSKGHNYEHRSSHNNRGGAHHGFNVDFEVRDDGPRGRSIYSTHPISKNTHVYSGSWVVKFTTPDELVAYLKLLPHDLQCDVLLWAFPSGSNGHAYVALDEGSFVNHGETNDSVNLDTDCRTTRDVVQGEELLEDYGHFINKSGGWFEDIRKRAWQDKDKGSSLKRYVSLGAPEQSGGSQIIQMQEDDDDDHIGGSMHPAGQEWQSMAVW